MRAADRWERLLVLHYPVAAGFEARLLVASGSHICDCGVVDQGMQRSLGPGSEAYLGGFGRPGPRTPHLLLVYLAELGPFVLAAEPVLRVQPYSKDDPFVLVADRYLRSALVLRRDRREGKPSRRRRAEPLTSGK